MGRSLFLVAALALSAPLVAQAKERDRAQICGVSGCVVIVDEHPLEQHPLGAVAAPPPEEFYVLSFTGSAGTAVPERFAMYYVRSRRILAANGATRGSLTWFPATEQAIEALEAAIAEIEPFPQPAAWPAELKSAGRVAFPGDAVPEIPDGSGIAWPLVAGSLVAVLLLGLGSLAIVRRSRRPRAVPA
jgi:hypothetical protein